MIRAPRLAILAITLTLSTASLACDELLATLDSGPPLAQSADAGVKAAAESHEVAQKEAEAQQSLTESLQSGQREGIEKAIELRPQDSNYRLYLAAWHIAHEEPSSGKDSAVSDNIIEARRLAHVPGLTPDEGFVRLFIQYLDALLVTRNTFEPDSFEWQRLNEAYCKNTAHIFNDHLATVDAWEFDVRLFRTFYSFDTCQP